MWNCVAFLLCLESFAHGFLPSIQQKKLAGSYPLGLKDDGWVSDFDDFGGASDDDSMKIFQLFHTQKTEDLSSCRSRQFSLGRDLVLADFVGNMGFDEVTDWEYYYQGEDGGKDRKVVQPNPFDASKPKRTRSSSGSVVRVFRGEFVGPLGGSLSARGMDRRVIVKEFFGDLALELARSELASAAKLQSVMLSKEPGAKDGEWFQAASSRSVMERQDNSHVMRLLTLLGKERFLGILGEVNLAELDDMDANEFYRALGVAPPKPDAVWIVYEYAGLSSIASYAQPGEIRRQSLPPKRGFFGAVVDPPPLPAWRKRADYVVKGILKGALEAVASIHDNQIAHRSIGRSSILLSSTTMDKRDAISPYTTSTAQLQVKLADFGFSGPLKDSTMDDGFRTRARSFGLFFKEGEVSITSSNFAVAEDMHALGFVFVGLLLSSLAEIEKLDDPIPPTDEDTLQRLLGDIFEKDFIQFREYVDAEEAWTNLVQLLDENDRAGWKVLETLFLARERVSDFKDSDLMFTSRGLLSSPFFNVICY